MRTVGRCNSWLVGAAVAVAGCRTPALPSSAFTPTPPPPPTVLPAAKPGSLEPDYAGLPTADPLAEPVPTTGTPYRELTEATCRDLAAAHSPEAALLRDADLGSRTPNTPTRRRLLECCETPPGTAGPRLETLRELAVADARNAAAADALEQFYRLADAEGRGKLLRDSVPLLDELRAAVKTARAGGVRVPTDPAELDRQRGQLLAAIGQADLGTALLNTDLKRRIGVDGRDPGRLWPTGPFPMTADPVDTEAAVQVALQRRPDLQLLRTAYLRWEELKLDDPSLTTEGRQLLSRFGFEADKLLASGSVLSFTRQQLYDLTAAKERAAADEVRAAAATLAAQTRQVALARWRADQLTAEAEKAKPNGPLAELPARAEAVRARADVVAAVFAWQQARIKLLAAQGAFAVTHGEPGA